MWWCSSYSLRDACMPLHITAYHCVYYGATDEFDERLHQPSNDDKFNIIWLGVFSKKGQKLETTCVTGCHLSIRKRSVRLRAT